jgi:3-methyladenine DNA glycosylase AlkC
MPEPFKNLLNRDLIDHMAACFNKAASNHNEHIGHADAQFDSVKFVKVASNNLESLEMKQRSDQITEAMKQSFPDDFALAAAIIHSSLAPVQLNQNTDDIGEEGIAGWAIWPITIYVGMYGLEHFDISLTVLKEATKRFSSEFGIRYFILADAERCMKTLQSWAVDENYHVRLLASEGSRPRLPWGMKLPMYIDDPSPLLSLLERMKDDSEEYVRRSVANSLNDIAKDHPSLVAQTAKSWLKGASKNRTRLVRHACRTLLKQGNAEVLSAFGYHAIDTSQATLSLSSRKVGMGESIEFTFELPASAVSKPQLLMIDYIIHHQKANGTTSPKVFKWKSISHKVGEKLVAQKAHIFKPITTRVYHSGQHFIEIVVNGVSAGKAEFELVL